MIDQCIGIKLIVMTSHVEVCWTCEVFALNLVKENDLRTMFPHAIFYMHGVIKRIKLPMHHIFNA